MSEPTWLVVGLGNPGPGFARNRHNVGYLVLDELAAELGGRFRSHRTRGAEVLESRLNGSGTGGSTSPSGVRVVLTRSRTFMNESGSAVAALTGFFHIPVSQLVAVHDELDLPFESLRVKLGGGDNGHNGLRSIRRALGSGDFYRVRVGIGRPPGRQSPADFVLSDYRPTERALLPLQVGRAADAVRALVTEGLAETQNRFNY